MASQIYGNTGSLPTSLNDDHRFVLKLPPPGRNIKRYTVVVNVSQWTDET